jgi:hypothetical protein
MADVLTSRTTGVVQLAAVAYLQSEIEDETLRWT